VRDLPAAVGPRFEALLRGYEAVRSLAPTLTATQIDDFLERVGRIVGRELPGEAARTAAVWSWQPEPDRVEQAVREVRTRFPLRKRLRDADPATTAALARFQAAARAGDFAAAW